MNRSSTLTATATALGGAATYAVLLRRRQLHWGATAEECGHPLPGDEILPEADLCTTRAVTVHAPAAAVWPWLAQMGQGKAGFYSYDRLESLFGCDIHNADLIVPAWQEVAVGDEMRLAPGTGLDVAVVQPARALVVRSGAHSAPAAGPFDFTWAWVLHEQGDETRLLVRERYRYRRRWAALLVEPVQLVSFVMTERMLRGIRERSEQPA